MSILKFDLKEEHVKLLKHLRWSKDGNNVIVGLSDNEDSVPFGENNIYEAIDLILNGRPEDFNPFDADEIVNFSKDQKANWDNLYKELPMALDIILYTGKFELGSYKTKWHDRDWKKIN
jgi:hypothetical protein